MRTLDHMRLTCVLLVLTSCQGFVSLGTDRVGIAEPDGGADLDAGLLPTSLSFIVEPSSARPNAPLSPAVQVALVDSAGQVVATDSGTNVTLALTGDPRDVVLSGTLTQPTVNGIATFPDLGVSQVGLGYTLTASAPDANEALSSTFDVTPGTVLGGVGPYGLGSLDGSDAGPDVEPVDAGCETDGGC